LYAAIEEFVDNISERSSQDLVVTMELPPSNARYDLKIEEYLYRIVQEACENAIQHAQARSIQISGRLDPTNIVLVVKDDGIGFQALGDLSFEKLLATKHYGFAGMHERAAIIGAELHFDTTLGGGTRLSITKNLTGNENTVNQ
jgi:two-component system sensor histidine kinase DegS